MTLDEIETFLGIARLGGFTEASHSLGRSQPAISRRIHQLEEALGATLFERVGHRVSLTDAGKVFLPHAAAVLAAARDGERAVRASGGAGRPQVRMTSSLGARADAHVAETLRAFEGRHAAASGELMTAPSREVSSLVRSGDAHLGLRYVADADPRLESKALGVEQLGVV